MNRQNTAKMYNNWVAPEDTTTIVTQQQYSQHPSVHATLEIDNQKIWAWFHEIKDGRREEIAFNITAEEARHLVKILSQAAEIATNGWDENGNNG